MAASVGMSEGWVGAASPSIPCLGTPDVAPRELTVQAASPRAPGPRWPSHPYAEAWAAWSPTRYCHVKVPEGL